MDDPSTEGDNPPALTARTVESLEGTFDFEEDESEDTIEKENTSYDSSLAATNHDQNNQNTLITDQSTDTDNAENAEAALK